MTFFPFLFHLCRTTRIVHSIRYILRSPPVEGLRSRCIAVWSTKFSGCFKFLLVICSIRGRLTERVEIGWSSLHVFSPGSVRHSHLDHIHSFRDFPIPMFLVGIQVFLSFLFHLQSQHTSRREGGTCVFSSHFTKKFDDRSHHIRKKVVFSFLSFIFKGLTSRDLLILTKEKRMMRETGVVRTFSFHTSSLRQVYDATLREVTGSRRRIGCGRPSSSKHHLPNCSLCTPRNAYNEKHGQFRFPSCLIPPLPSGSFLAGVRERRNALRISLVNVKRVPSFGHNV
jgi:hypothetical protein